MDQRSNPIPQDMKEISETRAAMSEKLEELEERVQETVQDARDTVLDVVDHVRNAAEALVDRAGEFVEQTKQAFDPTYQVTRHPWMMLGGAIAAGYLLGTLEQRQAPGRTAQQRLPYGGSAGYSTRPAGHTWERANIWDGIAREVQNEVEHTKEALIEVGRSFIRDFFQQAVPALLGALEGRKHDPRYPRSYRETKGNGSNFSPRDT